MSEFLLGPKRRGEKLAWVAWEKCFLPKKAGGLGMRDFKIFNKALLAKQAWRVLTLPNSLMARVLKGKYFPHTEFLKTKVSPCASFTWKSILSARELIMKGACKMIGNGHETNIWSDPWIPSLPLYRITTDLQRRDVEGPTKVNELIEAGEWKENELSSLFLPWEVRAIRNIPIPIRNMEDFWSWQHTKNGNFTVRSAYYVALNGDRQAEPTASTRPWQQVWSKIWGACVPAKVKMFGWKAARNGIAVKANLVKRGMGVDKECPRCGEGAETTEHML